MSWTSMFKWVMFGEILLPSSYLSKHSPLKHTCSWHGKLIVLWTLNRQAKISLRTFLNCYWQNLMSWRDTGHHLQGFLNSSKGWGESEILMGKIFYQVKETWGDVILAIRTFFKANNSFLWILNNKIKINMT